MQLLFIVQSVFTQEAGCQRVPLQLPGCAMEPGTIQAKLPYPLSSPPAKPCVSKTTLQLTTSTAI